MALTTVATINVHAFATRGSVHDLATIMHELAKFPEVWIATVEDEPGALRYVVDDGEPEPEPGGMSYAAAKAEWQRRYGPEQQQASEPPT